MRPPIPMLLTLLVLAVTAGCGQPRQQLRLPQRLRPTRRQSVPAPFSGPTPTTLARWTR